MNYNSNNKIPEFIEPILKKERIVFQTLAQNFNTKNFYILKGFLILTILLGTSVLYNKNIANILKLLQEYRFNPIATFTELATFDLILIFAIITLATLTVFLIIQLLKKNQIGPWFIGTDNFLLIANNHKSIPVSWHYISSDIKIKKNKNSSTIILRYDRKDFANPIVNSILKNNNKYQIPIKNIQNAEQIAGLILAKIKNN